MDAQTQELMKQALLKRQKELEEDLQELHINKDGDYQGQDSADQASTAVSESLENSLQSTELEEYTMNLKALEMIEKGTYGICMECSQPIPEKRLKFYPNATRCLLCQEALEQDMRSMINPSL